ncbi:MAG TPA: diguanylate cyclase [Polyangiaceae bacterium]|nr:diguanylate cyclase [Polyangiaceae bacterium]
MAPSFPTVAWSPALRVLIAEDDPDVREALEHAVRRLGHSCEVARDGREAWTMHRAHRADLIISDWKMPRMSGLQLCRGVRGSDPPQWHTHFILVTGRSDAPQLAECLRAGADEYATKPLDLGELEARLEAVRRVVAVHRTIEADNVALRVGAERRLRDDLEPLEGRASRYGHRYCAARCDIDGFEAYRGYNDYFGHMSGDAAFGRVARTIQRHLRSGDTVYRYGGQELLVILPEQSLLLATRGMDRVRREVEGLCIRHVPVERNPFLTINVGIAELGGGSVEDWLRRADAALYRAKSRGRNRADAQEAVSAPSLPSGSAACSP